MKGTFDSIFVIEQVLHCVGGHRCLSGEDRAVQCGRVDAGWPPIARPHQPRQAMRGVDELGTTRNRKRGRSGRADGGRDLLAVNLGEPRRRFERTVNLRIREALAGGDIPRKHRTARLDQRRAEDRTVGRRGEREGRHAIVDANPHAHAAPAVPRLMATFRRWRWSITTERRMPSRVFHTSLPGVCVARNSRPCKRTQSRRRYP